MFESIVTEDRFPLAEAFLAFASAEYPSLDAGHYLRALDDLADGVSPDLDDLRGRLLASGFAGNEDSYADPRNSFLNEVIDTGLGIPISLSVVWIEVGLRAGLVLRPVALPMHFLVGCGDLYVDPFHGGRILTSDEVLRLFARLTGGRVPWNDAYLQEASPRDVVRRALHNLKAVYGTTGQMRKALWVENHLLAIPGAPAQELRERAIVLARLGRTSAAIDDLATYLGQSPDDHEIVEEQIRELSASLN